LDIYDKINFLLKSKNITKRKMCDDLGLSYNSLMSMFSRQSENLSLSNIKAIATYLDATLDYLIRDEELDPNKNVGSTEPTLEDIKFALFEKRGVDDETYEEVKQFAHFTEDRKRRQNEPK